MWHNGQSIGTMPPHTKEMSMSDFQTHLQDVNDPYGTQPQAELQSTSGLAIGSLICSLIICCPLVTIFGPILGIAAMGKIGSPPRQRGKGLAIAGIIIGILTTVASSVLIFYGVRHTINIFKFIETAPQQAMQAGTAGDLNAFRSSFHGVGANASDEQIQSFLDDVEERYGDFVSTEVDRRTAQPVPFGSTAFPMSFILQFRDTAVTAEVEVILADPATGKQMQKIGYILIEDSDLGDLRFPPVQ
jgi:hypothetical protein